MSPNEILLRYRVVFHNSGSQTFGPISFMCSVFFWLISPFFTYFYQVNHEKNPPWPAKKPPWNSPEVAAIQPPAWRSPLQQGALGAAPVQRTIRGGLSASAWLPGEPRASTRNGGFMGRFFVFFGIELANLMWYDSGFENFFFLKRHGPSPFLRGKSSFFSSN